ncbi:MAG: hypothetical protein Fur005_32560 [Roseiflexaceae bacterium]
MAGVWLSTTTYSTDRLALPAGWHCFCAEAIGVQPHERLTVVAFDAKAPAHNQIETDPNFPGNIMAAALALSYRMAATLADHARQHGPPDLLLIEAEHALGYFLLQRRLTEPQHPLAHTPVVVIEPVVSPSNSSSYRFPTYWINRLSEWCLKAADARVGSEALSTPAMLDLPALIAAARMPISFPANTAEAQGACLPKQADEQEGLLSVIIPFYNMGPLVGETIASAAAAVYRPLEIIVLDDGSSPAHQQQLAAAAAHHADLVRIIRTPNGGLARARNAGAEAARGEFITFLDADDLVAPDYYPRALAVLRRFQNVSFVTSWVRLFGAIDACLPTWNPEFPFLLGRNMLAAFPVLRRADFLAYGLNNPAIAPAFEDHEAWIRMLAHGCVGVSLPDPLAFYRVREDSMLRQANLEQQTLLMERIAQLHEQLYQRYGSELFALQNANDRALRWNHPGAATIDYMAKHAEAEQAYAQLRQRFAPLDPLIRKVVTIVSWLRGPRL